MAAYGVSAGLSLAVGGLPPGFDIQGHRGARALFPENTLAGFDAAVAMGATSIELDVVLSADGAPMVLHDLTLNPDIVRDRSGAWVNPNGPAVATLPAAVLATYDVGRLRPGSRTAARFPRQAIIDGAGIPTLADVLARYGNGVVGLDVELKCEASPADKGQTEDNPALATLVGAVVAMVAACQDVRITLRSFNWAALRRVRAMAPAMKLAWLTGAGARPEAVLAEIARLGWPAWQPVWAPDHRTLLRRQVRRAKAAGLLVKPWTVNAPARMQRLVSWGVDGLCTDRPDLAVAVCDGRGRHRNI